MIRAARADDVAVLLELLGELAEYEHLKHELRATESGLAGALFGTHPLAHALIAERDAHVQGYALFYATFSSFRTSAGVWLEDLFVRPPFRGRGVGRALLAAVAETTLRGGGERLEWAALDWNELALGFYEGLGARRSSEWITHRLDEGALARLALEARGVRDTLEEDRR